MHLTMTTETSNRRTRFYNRLAKGGLIASALAFGSLIAVVFLPLEGNVGMVIAGVGVLALIMSAFIMIGAIAARDIPTWKKNRWQFSIATLLNVMLAVAMVLGAIAAAERDVGAVRMLLSPRWIMESSRNFKLAVVRS